MSFALVAGLALTAVAQAPAAAQPHPFTVMDMQAMERISEPQLSPDKKLVAYTLRTTDMDANKGRTDIWVVGVDGKGARQLTTHEANDASPRWLADGKSLLFLSTRSGSQQLWRINLDGGEPTQVTRLPVDVESVVVFPDGKRVLMSLSVYPDLPADKVLEETAKRDAEKEKSKVKARAYDSLLYRHWDTWEDGKRSHLFTWTIGEGNPVDLLAGFDGDSPTQPWGGPEEISISPDGKEVVFAATMMSKEAAWSTDVNLFSVPAVGGAAPKPLTADNKAADTLPSFSPDGKWLAYLAMRRPMYESDQLRIILVDRKTGAKKELTKDWDRSAGELVWSADSKTIFTTADNVGNHSVFAVDVASGKVTTPVDKGHNASPIFAGSRLLFLQDTLSSPAELFSVALPKGNDLKPVTTVNAARVKSVQWGSYEQFNFPGAKGEKVHGWVVKPAGFKDGQKYPVAFLVHGGPQGSFGNHFHYRWNPQVYAGAGYAAVFIDFHGSTGYGQAFTDAINKDWGGAPYEDLMKGLDFALQKYPFLDGNRVAALGASYGGYMINWLAGHTDRFKCLVNHDGIFDTRMGYYDTEELWFPEWEHGGKPWEVPESYEKDNPAQHVKNWKTPMLVVHGGRDYRVVETQGMATFSALQRKGIPSRFLHFPDENHWVLKPQNSVLWHKEVLGWLDKWTKAEVAQR
ncbi:MAG: S9 family peptidase [Myxococcota bacterium]